MGKRKKRQYENTVSLSFPAVPGATGYRIYGIAPIPVRVEAGESPVRIEPTSDGYNLYKLKG